MRERQREIWQGKGIEKGEKDMGMRGKKQEVNKERFDGVNF